MQHAKRLQLFITEYRTNKARADYAYYSSLEQQLRGKYQTAQRKYAAYADSHQDLGLKSYETKLTDLENEMQNAFNAYTQMKQQVQMAEAKIQERTPVFTVVEDAYVPLRPTAPKKALMLAAFLFLSMTGTVAYFISNFSLVSHAIDSSAFGTREFLITFAHEHLTAMIGNMSLFLFIAVVMIDPTNTLFHAKELTFALLMLFSVVRYQPDLTYIPHILIIVSALIFGLSVCRDARQLNGQ